MINEPAALLSGLFEVQSTKSLCQKFELLHILLLSTQDEFVGSCAHNIELFHPVLKADVRWWASKSVWRMYGYVFAAFNTIEIEIVVGAWIQLLGHKQKGNIMVYLTFLSLLSDEFNCGFKTCFYQAFLCCCFKRFIKNMTLNIMVYLGVMELQNICKSFLYDSLKHMIRCICFSC